jgi:multiple sugar transport system substrate-binding protein/raffinose/stachyose/melibiose transport system substrate-binding protein
MSRIKVGFFISLLMVAALVVPSLATAQAPKTIAYNSYNGDPCSARSTRKSSACGTKPTLAARRALDFVAHEDFKQAIRAYLTAEPALDVRLGLRASARVSLSTGLIAPLFDMWKANGSDTAYAPGFNALSTVGEDQYFLPTAYYWWAIYYSKSAFEKAGITKEPETWDELLATCDALNTAGYSPFTIGTKYPWTSAAWFDYLNMRVNGPQFHLDLMLLKESYTDPRVAEVFNYWNQLFEHNCFIEEPAAYAWQEALDFMVQGEAAMYLMGQFIKDSYPDELEGDLDFFRFPIINPDADC